MNSLFAEFRDRAELRLVYVAEAHAEDEWPISSGRYTADGCPVTLKQPRSAEERIAAQQRAVSDQSAARQRQLQAAQQAHVAATAAAAQAAAAQVAIQNPLPSDFNVQVASPVGQSWGTSPSPMQGHQPGLGPASPGQQWLSGLQQQPY